MAEPFVQGRARPIWRVVAALYAFGAGLAVMGYERAQPQPWGWRNNGWIFLLQLVLFGVSVVMYMWNARCTSRLRRIRDDGGRPASSLRPRGSQKRNSTPS